MLSVEPSQKVEWSDKNKYNSFNSAKGLTYYENYKQIVAWMEGESTELPPPIECNLDPVAECNLRCYFCITQRYLRYHREEVGEMRQLPRDYMYRLVDFLAQWGVRGLCISGGGEPSLHKGAWGLPSYAKSKGMDVSFVTNGVSISDELAENLMSCRWASFSVNAADRETYKAVMGADKFDQMVTNVAKLVNLRRQTNSKVDFCFRMLILPENYASLGKACKLAKKLGVQDFNIRPVDFERKDIEGTRKLNFNIDVIREQFALCHEEESEDFHVYTVTHKFDPELHVKHDFKRCFATLILPILTDGNAYLCVDKKMEAQFRIGSAYPNPEKILEWWGSEKHRQMLKSVDINKCSRCTGSQYNRQIEEVVLCDNMCLAFP